MYVELLQTIAQVSATLAGFIGVVFILGRRAEGQLTAKESSGLFHLLYTALGALLFALVLAAALAATNNHPATWRIGSGLLAAYNLFGASKAATQERGGRHSLPRALAWPLPAGGFALTVANTLVAAGFLKEFAPIACIACLIWFLIVSVTYFVSLLLTRKDAA